MSASASAPLAPRPNASNAPSVLIKREIVITPDYKYYRDIFKAALSADNNAALETMIPTTDKEFLEFFARAIAKELKYILSSEVAPAVWAEVGKSPDKFFDVLPSSAFIYKERGLNVIKDAEEAGKGRDPERRKAYLKAVVHDSIIVLAESLRALYSGAPLKTLNQDKPTTLFLYYRWVAGIPVYNGHIFVQPFDAVGSELPMTFFVSVNRSLFAPKGVSTQALADVEAYARSKGHVGIFTAPLRAMIRTLEASGFQKLDEEMFGVFGYVKFLPAAAATGGASASTTVGGGRRRQKQRRTQRQKRRHRGQTRKQN